MSIIAASHIGEGDQFRVKFKGSAVTQTVTVMSVEHHRREVIIAVEDSVGERHDIAFAHETMIDLVESYVS